MLNLNGCTKITDSTCVSLSKFCSKLKQLDLTSCVSVSNHSLKALRYPPARHGGRSGGGAGAPEPPPLRDRPLFPHGFVPLFSDGCRMLELLNLSWCDQITRDGVEALARGCNALRALFLRGCTQVRSCPAHTPDKAFSALC